MSEESVISEEMRSMLGVEVAPVVEAVEKGHVRRFVEAIGDPNPLWQDREYAVKTGYGGVIAPPTFFQELGLTNIASKVLEMECPLEARVYGGVETEFHKPMKLGDVITARYKLADLYEKEARSGKFLFLVFEATLTNQNGELVAKNRHTFIRM